MDMCTLQNKTISFVLTFCLLLPVFLIFPRAVLAVTFDLKELVEVEGQQLTIGDIAHIRPADKSKILRNKFLFNAPDPGETRRYKAETLMAYVRECVDQDETIKWIGPDVVEVRQKGHLITTEQMRTIVDSYIEKHVPSDGSSQVRFEVRSMPQAFTVPHGKIVYKVVPSSPNILEARQFSIIFRHKGQVLKNVRLRGQIHALQQVAVAYCQLERDQLVQADDIHMVSKDITSCDHPFLKKEDVVGKKIRRTLYPGQVIEARWVERPDLIERGQLITMYIQKGSLLISAQGIACSDGKKDQIIKIKNISSEKNVYCKIISADKAIVEY